MSAITIIILIIFIIVVLIIYVFLFYYNRTINPTPIITDFGFTLSTNDKQYISIESLLITPDTGPIVEPVLVLQNLQNGTPNASQGWEFWILYPNGSAQKISSLGDSDIISGQTQVAIRNTYTEGFVTYFTSGGVIFPGSVNASSSRIDNPFTKFFIIEFDVITNIVKLKAVGLPQINGQDQYLIPGSPVNIDSVNVVPVTIGVPGHQQSNEWIVG